MIQMCIWRVCMRMHMPSVFLVIWEIWNASLWLPYTGCAEGLCGFGSSLKEGLCARQMLQGRLQRGMNEVEAIMVIATGQESWTNLQRDRALTRS